MLEDLFFIEYKLHLLLLSGANDEALIIERNNLRKKLNYYKLVALVSIEFINSYSFVNSIDNSPIYAVLPCDSENLFYFDEHNGKLLLKKDFDCIIKNYIS
jgi:hypothetical protein